jgi:S-formylglutathione hydrolase FrmB
VTPSRSARTSLLAVFLISLASGALAQEPVTTVEFYSPAVDRTMKYNIVLPAEYDSSDERYPVLYLLHGLSQSYTVWSRQGVPAYGEVFNDLIVVMPDGGNSWYVNFAENGGGQRNDWEDHIVQDVVGHVDANYRTITRREGRAIAGLSMGGYGSLTLGLRNPEMFISIGSTSGAISYGRDAARRMRGEPVPRAPSRYGRRQRSPEERAAREERNLIPDPRIGIEGFSSQVERDPEGRRFVTAEDADAYDPFVLIHQVPHERLPHIYLDSGTEDGLILLARELAQVMFEKDIPFDFMQMSGGHTRPYWTQSVGHIMSIQYEVMRRALGERPWYQR